MPGRLSIDMETPRHSGSSTANVRVAEVLYLICRGAQLEHPHMINVQYIAHQPGPALRDVKARLIALRGKSMADSFSWSYKRNYKDNFIWCDLFDDDFILPLSESGEYILKAVELYDASQDFSDGEIEYHSAREFLPVRNSRATALRKSSRPSTRMERLHENSDIQVARKNELVTFNEAGNITSDSCIEFSKQRLKSLSHGRRVTRACRMDPGDDCGSPSFEDLVENSKYAGSDGPTLGSIVSRSEGTIAVKRCNSSPHCVNRRALCLTSLQGDSLLQRDDTSNCREFSVDMTPTTTKKDKLLSVFSPSPITSPRSVPLRRRTWEKEINKINIYRDPSNNKSSEDEHSSPHLDAPAREILQEAPVAEDSFLNLLRKATRLGGLRPRLCRGVDVIDSTRSKTSKTHVRSKAKEDVSKLLFKSPVKHARSLFDEPARKSASSFAELIRKNHIRLPEKTLVPSLEPEKKSIPFAHKPVKEFKTLAEYFESKEKNLPVLKLMNEPHLVAGTPTPHLSSSQPESRPHCTAALATDPQDIDPPLPEPSPFGKNSLEITYQKTMEVLEQLSTSRQGAKSGAVRRVSLDIYEAEVSPVSQGEAKKIRSNLKGNKHDVEVDCRDNMHRGRSATTLEDDSEGTHLKQKRSQDKENSNGVVSRSGTLAVSYRAEAAVKVTDETVETLSTTSKLSSVEDINVASLVQRPENASFHSGTVHNGNRQGLKTREIKVAAEFNSSEEARVWPFQQPVRPRDFKSRDDRLLIPGVTHMDWQKTFQEAAIHSLPPEDLVLHECLQCGRTFKPDSLQVHKRGCHAINKPKPSMSTQRKRFSV